jgi:Ca2+/Na+ antiporter
MNKKGFISVGAVFAIASAIILLILLFGGGASALWDIAKFLGKVPAWIWVILIVIFIFRGRGGKKR